MEDDMVDDMEEDAIEEEIDAAKDATEGGIDAAIDATEEEIDAAKDSTEEKIDAANKRTLSVKLTVPLVQTTVALRLESTRNTIIPLQNCTLGTINNKETAFKEK